jgi:hypothetical protein
MLKFLFITILQHFNISSWYIILLVSSISVLTTFLSSYSNLSILASSTLGPVGCETNLTKKWICNLLINVDNYRCSQVGKVNDNINGKTKDYEEYKKLVQIESIYIFVFHLYMWVIIMTLQSKNIVQKIKKPVILL